MSDVWEKLNAERAVRVWAQEMAVSLEPLSKGDGDIQAAPIVAVAKAFAPAHHPLPGKIPHNIGRRNKLASWTLRGLVDSVKWQSPALR